MIQPLLLAPYEHYMLADDRSAYPMNFLARFQFTGQFDASLLQEALNRVLQDHPLLTTQANEQAGRWHWIATQTPITITPLPATPGQTIPPLPPIDIRQGPGLRVYLSTNDTHSDLIFHAHHACCDGLGLLDFVEDMFIHYTRLTPAIPTLPLPQRNAHCLSQRHRFGFTPYQLLCALPHQLRAFPSLCHFLRRSARPLLASPPASDNTPASHHYPCIYSQRLTAQHTQQLRRAAQTYEVTLNDLLIYALFQTLQRHQSLPPQEKAPWLRMCIPVNLRHKQSPCLPAMNQVSMSFLNRKTSRVRANEAFLRSIHREMKTIKQRHLGLAFTLGLRLAECLKGGLPLRCRSRRCQATAVLSNAGIAFAQSPLCNAEGQVTVGDIRLDNIDFMAPVRPKTNITLAAITYFNQLNLTLHYDPFTVDKTHAQTLLNDIVKELLSFLTPQTYSIGT